MGLSSTSSPKPLGGGTASDAIEIRHPAATLVDGEFEQWEVEVA